MFAVPHISPVVLCLLNLLSLFLTIALFNILLFADIVVLCFILDFVQETLYFLSVAKSPILYFFQIGDSSFP